MKWHGLPPELQDFRNFVCYAMREQGLIGDPTDPKRDRDKPITPTIRQVSVADWMANGPNRSLTVAFRGLGKSLLASYYALWRLAMDPFMEKVLVVSATSVKANDFSTFCLKAIHEIPALNDLAPGAMDRATQTAFDVAPAVVEQSPSLRSMGIMGSTTGQRCTCAILDDIETLANVITLFKQERVAHAVTEMESILKPEEGQLLPRRIMYLGTPHTEASIYLRLVRERGYKARYWPSQFPALDEQDCYDNNLDPLIEHQVLEDPSLAGLPTDPERFSAENLMERRASMTRSSFLLQFQLNTRLATLDRYPIRLGDLTVMDIDSSALPEKVVWTNAPESRMPDVPCIGMGGDRFWHRPMFLSGYVDSNETWRCVLAIDPAGRGHDELAWAVVAELSGNLFLLESGGTRLGYADEVLVHLAEVAKRWKVNLVVPEANMGDGMFTALLKPHLNRIWPCGVEEVKHSTRKEVRLCDTLAPVVQQHRLVLSTAVVRNDWTEAETDPETGYARSLAFQLSRLTQEKGCLEFDDRIDALAIAVAWFVDAAAQDQDVARQDRLDGLQEAFRSAWGDPEGAYIDQLAFGVVPNAGAGRAVGGFSRPKVGAASRRP